MQLPAAFLLAFWTFIAGGFAFAGVFVANWKVLEARPGLTVNVPFAGAVSAKDLPAAIVNAPRAAVGELKPPSAPRVVASLLPQWKGTEPINILLLGIDQRDDENAGIARTDTMMLVTIDPVGKAAAMVSIPRDLWVNIPGYAPQRINVAHSLGGPDLAKKTVSANFGVPVQYYARVNFGGFEDLVNAMGGVLVDVERPIKDDEYPTQDYGYQRIYIPPGPQLMDGQTALFYARSRHSENDFGRAARQQRVILAMRDRALQLNMLPKAPQLLGLVQKAVSTDLQPDQMLALARLGSELDRARITNLVIDANYATPFKGEGGADLLAPDVPAIRRAIDGALQRAERPELQARLEVLNGSGQPGRAQQAADLLSKLGYQVVRIDVADRVDYNASSIQVLTGSDRTAAEAVASALNLGSAVVTEQPTLDAAADLRVTIGRDFVLPPAPRR